jgi:hypothetical protein
LVTIQNCDDYYVVVVVIVVVVVVVVVVVAVVVAVVEVIIIICVTTFMQGIYNYISETLHVSRVAAVLHLQFVLPVMLFHP